MRALEIVMYAREEVNLPLSYYPLLQGLLYGCWRDDFSWLHDEGYGEDARKMRLFTFGPLEGKHHVNFEKKEISFSGLIRFEVRALDEDLLDALVAKLMDKSGIRLGTNNLALVDLQTCDRLMYPSRALIHTKAPVTVHRTIDDEGHTEYLAPSSADFVEMCCANLESKLRAMGFDDKAQLKLIPLDETIKKQVTTFKGIYITAWTGNFIVAAPPEQMMVLYHCGLGDRNSQGFGMFNIEEKPLQA